MSEVRPIDANALKSKGKFNQQTGNFIELCDLEKAPTLDYEPIVHAHWTEGFDHKHLFGWCRCSACGREIVYDFLGRFPKSRRCPNCGAKMEMDEEVKE